MGTLLNRRRYMGGGSSLPYDAEVEYIASTGTSGFYINSGVGKPSTFNSVMIETTVKFISTSGRQIHGALNALYFGVNNNRWETAYNTFRDTADTHTHIFSKSLTKSNNIAYFITALDGTPIHTYNAGYRESDFNNNIGVFNYDVSSTTGWYAEVYGEKIYLNDVLVRDYIPVRVGQVGYLYDKVSGQLFGNSGTGDFVLGPDSPNKQNTIPVEYLQCTTTQWINTKIVPDFNTTVEVKAALLTNSDCHTVSARTIQGDSGRFFAFSFFGGLQARFVIGDQVTIKPYVIETPYTILFNEQNTHKVYCDDELITEFTSGNTVTQQNPLILFGTSGYGTYPKEGTGINNVRIYYCKIIQNGVLVRDFAPVRKGTTGYMYDSVSDKFFGNNGTGDFVLGPDKT